MEYKFVLDKSSRKFPCPLCGKKTFVAYKDNLSGEYIDANTYGRCDRENNCGAHIHPISQNSRSYHFIPHQPAVTRLLPPEDIVSAIINAPAIPKSNFHKFCASLTIPDDHLLKWDVYKDQDKTVFLFRDRHHQIINLKWFMFSPTGRRIKTSNSYSLSQPKSIEGSTRIEKYFLCLYGEHLLDQQKEKTVCIVESEKSAALASFFYPQFDWVSCSSANGLSDGTSNTADKISSLFGRKIYWIADADKAGRNNSSIKNLKRYEQNFQIIDLFPDRNDGYDIGDAITDGLRPEIVEPVGPQNLVAFNLTKSESRIQEFLYDLPTNVKWEHVKMDVLRYNHFNHEGQIFMIRKPARENGNYTCQPITNFTINPLGLITSLTHPRRLIEINNIHDHKKVLEVPTKAFASHNEFTVFVESEGNFQFDGNGIDLKKIRSKLYDNMPSYEEIESLGWHKDGYLIFSNGVYNGEFKKIDEYGFVKMKDKYFYIEPLSCINKDKDSEWDDEKKFIYKESKGVTVQQWAQLFTKVHGNNGKIALIWFISSLFRDHVYKRLKFFPHWFGFGPPGTGKSQLGWSIRATGFSGIKKPFNLSLGTPIAFSKEVSQFTNIPCWYDEYENSIDPARIQGLKGFYDGSGHIKSIKDSKKRTETVPVLSACLITGQQLPIADVALFTRVILCQFHTTEFSKEERENFNHLEKMQEDGLPFITTHFIQYREKIEKEFHDQYDTIANHFQKEFDHIEVHTRLIRNMSVLLTTFKVLESELSGIIPFTYDEFHSIAITNVTEQASLIQGANETNTFWDMVSYLIDQNLIEEGKDYDFALKKEIKLRSNHPDGHTVQFEKSKELLFIRFSKILPLYREHFNKQNRNAQPMDKGSLIHYLQHTKPFIGSVKNYRFDGTPTTAFVFDYNLLLNQDIQLKRAKSQNGGLVPGEYPKSEEDFIFSTEPSEARF